MLDDLQAKVIEEKLNPWDSRGVRQFKIQVMGNGKPSQPLQQTWNEFGAWLGALPPRDKLREYLMM